MQRMIAATIDRNRGAVALSPIAGAAPNDALLAQSTFFEGVACVTTVAVRKKWPVQKAEADLPRDELRLYPAPGCDLDDLFAAVVLPFVDGLNAELHSAGCDLAEWLRGPVQ